MASLRLFRAIALLGSLAAAGSPAAGQSFDIDIDVASPSNVAWTGGPSVVFAGASGQAGVWQTIAATGAGPFTLRGLNGGTTGVTLTRSGAAGSANVLAVDNANSGGGWGLLLDDAQRINTGVTETITIAGLASGDYEIYTYAIAPDSTTARTSVSVAGSSDAAQTIGGTMPASSFTLGVTHALHHRSLFTGDSVVITLTGVSGVGTFSGLQIKQTRRDITYVKPGVAAGGDGGSWATAFRDISTALASLPTGGTSPGQVWISAGTYKPTTTTDRNASFIIPDNASLYGGFAGTETSLDQRNWTVNQTVLSGDIGTVGVATDNSRHIVRFITADAFMDGFYIRDGYDDDTSFVGGGGAGIVMFDGAPRIYECAFINNTSLNSGGAIWSSGAALTVYKCSFVGNRAMTGASAVGGAVHAESTSRYISFENVAFLGNSSRSNGGAVSAYGGAMDFINCVFDGNSSTNGQYAALDGGGNTTLVNCTIVNNAAPTQACGGVRLGFHGSLTNCVLYGNTGVAGSTTLPRRQLDLSGSVQVNFSLVQGWTSSTSTTTGVGVIDGDPMFVNALGADGLPGTTDDQLVPRAGSPLIDAGYNGALWTTSRDLADQPRLRNDPGTPDTGLGVGPLVDIGCYEFQPIICRADFNNSGAVTIQDIFDFLGAWFALSPAADINGVGSVTLQDLFDYLGLYFAGC